jgi:hypothetical protein
MLLFNPINHPKGITSGDEGASYEFRVFVAGLVFRPNYNVGQSDRSTN